MAANQFKEFISIGEALGLAGPDLLNFAREQSEADRLKRAEERQAAKEQKELELKLTQQQQEAAKQQSQVELAKREIELKLIEAQKVADAELRQFELQKLQIESETRLRSEELSSKTKLSLTEMTNDTEDSVTPTNNWFAKKFDLGLGYFDNVAEHLDSFISRFEIVAKAYELPSQLWPIEFSKCLNGESLTVYEMLDYESKTDFDALIQALRKNITLVRVAIGGSLRLANLSRVIVCQTLSGG